MVQKEAFRPPSLQNCGGARGGMDTPQFQNPLFPDSQNSWLPGFPPTSPGAPPPRPTMSSHPALKGCPAWPAPFSPQPGPFPQLHLLPLESPWPGSPPAEPQPHPLIIHLGRPQCASNPTHLSWTHHRPSACGAPICSSHEPVYGRPASVHPRTEMGLDLVRRQPAPLGLVVWGV